VRVQILVVAAAALAGCGDRPSSPLVSADAPSLEDGTCVVDGPPAPRPSKTWLVRPGDSLRRIARSTYGDENLWKAIRDANPGKVGRDGTIAVGAVLAVPFDGL